MASDTDSIDEVVAPPNEQTSPQDFIDQLPDELLLKIFKLVLHGWEGEDYPFTMMALHHISSRWRSIASNLPRPIVMPEHRGVNFVRKQLEWGSEHKLDIFSWLTPGGSRFNEITPLLLPTHDRWNTLVLNKCSFANLGFTQLQFPSLKTLWVSQCCLIPEISDSQAPALEDLFLSVYSIPQGTRFASSLRTLRIGVSQIGDLLTTLSFLENLTTLELTTYHTTDDGDYSPQPVHLPALRSLYLNLYDPGKLLSNMKAPALRRFWYTPPFTHQFDRCEGDESANPRVNRICLWLDEPDPSLASCKKCDESDDDYMHHVEPFLRRNFLLPETNKSVECVRHGRVLRA